MKSVLQRLGLGSRSKPAPRIAPTPPALPQPLAPVLWRARPQAVQDQERLRLESIGPDTFTEADWVSLAGLMIDEYHPEGRLTVDEHQRAMVGILRHIRMTPAERAALPPAETDPQFMAWLQAELAKIAVSPPRNCRAVQPPHANPDQVEAYAKALFLEHAFVDRADDEPPLQLLRQAIGEWADRDTVIWLGRTRSLQNFLFDEAALYNEDCQWVAHGLITNAWEAAALIASRQTGSCETEKAIEAHIDGLRAGQPLYPLGALPDNDD